MLSQNSLTSSHALSIRLTACRSLVRFIYKINLEQEPEIQETLPHTFFTIFDLLLCCSQHTIEIPIQTLIQLSKLHNRFYSRKFESPLQTIAKSTRFKEIVQYFLQLYLQFATQSIVCIDIMELFRVWVSNIGFVNALVNQFVIYAKEIVTAFHQHASSEINGAFNDTAVVGTPSGYKIYQFDHSTLKVKPKQAPIFRTHLNFSV